MEEKVLAPGASWEGQGLGRVIEADREARRDECRGAREPWVLVGEGSGRDVVSGRSESPGKLLGFGTEG